jgi:hypothetical protein
MISSGTDFKAADKDDHSEASPHPDPNDDKGVGVYAGRLQPGNRMPAELYRSRLASRSGFVVA